LPCADKCRALAAWPSQRFLASTPLSAPPRPLGMTRGEKRVCEFERFVVAIVTLCYTPPQLARDNFHKVCAHVA
jgi:hypothetical protein